MRRGLLGGAFNPPTLAHTALAEHAISQLELDELVVMPTGRPAHKQLAGALSAADRLDLCRAAFGHLPQVTVSDLELNSPDPSRTWRTLEELAESAPAEETYVIVGADQGATLPLWERPDLIGRYATIALASRPGTNLDAALEGASKAGLGRPVIIDLPASDISSTQARLALMAGRPTRGVLSDRVADVCRERCLYFRF